MKVFFISLSPLFKRGDKNSCTFIIYNRLLKGSMPDVKKSVKSVLNPSIRDFFLDNPISPITFAVPKTKVHNAYYSTIST